MKVTASESKTIRKALSYWRNNKMINDELFSSLDENITIEAFNWKKLARYAFWVALICIVISVTSLITDKDLYRIIEAIMSLPVYVRFTFLALLASVFYYFGNRRRLQHPEKIFSSEAILFLGVLATGAAIQQFGELFGSNSEHFSLLLLLSFIIYGFLGYYFSSTIIWVFALLSLGSWLGTETGYLSGWGAYYLGLNYPIRFVLFGTVVTAAAIAMEKDARWQSLQKSTLIIGLLYLFVSLWLLSIFGNYGDLTTWYQVKQIELFHWSLLFGIVACGAIYHGLRFDNNITKGFGLTFLFINLYTRYFEYFWDATPKTIFFAVLAISFWYLGTKAEKIWSLGEDQKS